MKQIAKDRSYHLSISRELEEKVILKYGNKTTTNCSPGTLALSQTSVLAVVFLVLAADGG